MRRTFGGPARLALLVICIVGAGCPFWGGDAQKAGQSGEVIGQGCWGPVGTNPLLPSVEFEAAPLTGPAPLTVQFTDRSTAGDSPISSWAWDFGDGAISGEANPTHIYEHSGTFTVTLTAVSIGGQNQVIKRDLIQVTSPATADTIDPINGGTITRDGVSLSLPGGVASEDLAIQIKRSQESLWVSVAERESVISDVFEISYDLSAAYTGRELPLTPQKTATLAMPFDAAAVAAETRLNETLCILASMPDGSLEAVPGRIESGRFTATLAGLPPQATYAVVYRPEALTARVNIATTKAYVTGATWNVLNWRIDYSPQMLRELSALRAGDVSRAPDYDRRDFSQAQLDETLSAVKSSVTRIHSLLRDAGLPAPLLGATTDGEYVLSLDYLAPTPRGDVALSEEGWVSMRFGNIVIDPAMLLYVSKLNAASGPDQAQELALETALAQQLYHASFRGYGFPNYTEESLTDLDVYAQKRQMSFAQALDDAGSIYFGQIAAAQTMPRAFSEGDIASLNEALFAPFSNTTPGYAHAFQDFLFYMNKNYAGSDPLAFLADSAGLPPLNVNPADPCEAGTVGGILQRLYARVNATSSCEVNELVDAQTALVMAANSTLSYYFDSPLATLYWEYAIGRAIENGPKNALRPTDEALTPWTPNESRFGKGIGTHNFQTGQETASIFHSDDAWKDVLGEIQPLSSRMVIFVAPTDEAEIPCTLSITCSPDGQPDAFGNGLKIRAYPLGLSPDNAQDYTSGQPMLFKKRFGDSDSTSGYTRVAVLFVNTSLTTAYSVDVTAETSSEENSNYGLLEGVVTEIDGTTPIRNVTVRITSGSMEPLTQLSSAEGHFAFSEVPAGNVTIQFKKTGYLDETRALEIPSDDTLWISVSMKSTTSK